MQAHQVPGLGERIKIHYKLMVGAFLGPGTSTWGAQQAASAGHPARSWVGRGASSRAAAAGTRPPGQEKFSKLSQAACPPGEGKQGA